MANLAKLRESSTPDLARPSSYRTFRDILDEQWQNDLKSNQRPFWKSRTIFDKKRPFAGAELHGSSLMHGAFGVLLMGSPGTGKSTVWSNLISMGHPALADDSVNLLFSDRFARLMAPSQTFRFRELSQYNEFVKQKIRNRGGPDAQEHARHWRMSPRKDGLMFRGAPVPDYPSMPMDPAPLGRRLHYVFLLQKSNKPGVRIQQASRNILIRHFCSTEHRLFPTLFGDERTISEGRVRRLDNREKRQIVGGLIAHLYERGVQFFSVNVPYDKARPHKSKQVAAAIHGFLDRRTER